jgi:hypothetical protein
MNNSLEIKKNDLNSPANYNINLCQDFVDISLSSEDDIPLQKVDEWLTFKSIESKSFSDSLALMSTLLHSERKISVNSRAGSMVDSFTVNLPMHNKVSN